MDKMTISERLEWMAFHAPDWAHIEIKREDALTILAWKDKAHPEHCHECDGEESVDVTGRCICGTCESPPEAVVPCPKCQGPRNELTCRS